MRFLVVLCMVSGCDVVFGLDPLDPSEPVFIRADHTNYADHTARPQVDASITQVDAGDLMIVAVCSERDNPVDSVVDDNHTTYASTAPIVVATQGLTLQADIYYARIAAQRAPFAVHVHYTAPVEDQDVRLAEYASVGDFVGATNGMAANDVSLQVGPLAVTTTPTLMIAATCVGNYTRSVTDYTQRIYTSPNGNGIYDQIANTPGDYVANVETTEGIIIVNLAAFGRPH